MSYRKHFIFSFAFLVACIPTQIRAQNACTSQSLLHQQKDEATIQRLEKAWSVAYLRGDTEFEKCLLTPDFTQIMRNGEVKFLSDELGFAEKNKGKNLSISGLPGGAVLIHGDVAVAYGESKSTNANGRPKATRYADYYVWEHGTWHAFFAQQTPVESKT